MVFHDVAALFKKLFFLSLSKPRLIKRLLLQFLQIFRLLIFHHLSRLLILHLARSRFALLVFHQYDIGIYQDGYFVAEASVEKFIPYPDWGATEPFYYELHHLTLEESLLKMELLRFESIAKFTWKPLPNPHFSEVQFSKLQQPLRSRISDQVNPFHRRSI